MTQAVAFLVLFGLFDAWAWYGAQAVLVPCIFLLLIALVLRVDNHLEELNPRWLGADNYDGAAQDLLNPQPQSVVAQNADKITKTAESDE